MLKESATAALPGICRKQSSQRRQLAKDDELR